MVSLRSRLGRLRLAFLVVGLAGMLLQAWRQFAVSEVPGVSYGVAARVEPHVEPGLGTNVELLGRPADEIGSVLDATAQAGFTWVRQTFAWEDIEPAEGAFQWSEADALVQQATERGLQLVAVLGTSPAWARPPGQESAQWSPPADFTWFGDFVAEFARRYGDDVTYYQIWDQPNIYPYWGDCYVDPEHYGRLLREAASRIRAEDPDAVILAAGLAPNSESGPLNVNEIDYLRRLLDSGAGDYFDVAALKAYGFEEEADDHRIDVSVLNFSRLALLHQALVDAGREDTPVWAVEFGWNALPADWEGREAPWGTGTGAEQAEQSWLAIERARREWPWLGPMIWARLLPPADASDPAYGFALLEEDLTPTELGAELLPKLADGAVPTLGWHAPTSGDVSYSAGWRVSDSAADPGAAGDWLTIDFQGTALDLILSPGPYWATWTVEVDGQPSATLPSWEGESYTVLYDPLGEGRRVTVASGLEPGVHQVRITVEGGWGQWPLRGWVSWREAPAAPGLLGWVASGLLLVAGLALLRADQVALSLVRLLSRLADPVPEWSLLLIAAGLGAAFWLSDGPALAVLAGTGLAIVALAAPSWVLSLALASLPFFLVPKTVLGFSLTMPELLSWLLLLGGLVRSWGRLEYEGLALRLRPLDVGVALLLFAVALSARAAPRPGVALHDFRRVTLSAAVLYAGARMCGPGALRPAVIGVLAGAVVASGGGLLQFVQGENLIRAGEVARVRAWYGSPNNLALYLGRCIPLALAVAAFARGRPVRWLGAVAALALLACGVLTRSRSLLLLGLPVAAVWLLWHLGWLRRRRTLWLAGAAALVLAGAVLAGGRVGSLLTGEDEAATARLHLWSSAVQMIADHPWLGVGPDNFLYLYRTGYILPSAWAEPNLSHPHNLVLDFWLTGGLAGVVALAWLSVAGFRQALRALRGAATDERAIYLGLAGALLAAVAQGLVDNSFFLVDLSHLTLAYLALFANAAASGSRVWSVNLIPPRGASR